MHLPPLEATGWIGADTPALEWRASPRLPKKLLQLGASHGREEPHRTRIGLRLSQQDLGEVVGTSRESINKQLRQWAERGVLSMNRGVITLHDLDALESLAGLSVV